MLEAVLKIILIFVSGQTEIASQKGFIITKLFKKWKDAE